ncbi:MULTISPECIES: hypothetical protein [Commensalibacter]|uniref:Transmembrane protein n=2 Tax=Commensalibacter TaxID=1079922 RepID=W7DTN3_9PROT|nr:MULTISPECIES: hypothetical protein [Commensalibacter]EUK17603.1 hypothetical protein COMX_09096 [Commensalibacter papalotli (ex Servin-Garciduenas et al. 2014)]CAI3952924.1 Flavodoxin/ferredoxin--NADP reductase (Fpr) (PDB:3OZU) [Commensalibacter papalotli (ex Botero et al. 2024)]CAI3953446.1 Flavodoxin/ferredoxin--NADP reductase (Fpr) (PDB:3OZU) [Commensalibacter papalotli (ex Botero et al. 2024)]
MTKKQVLSLIHRITGVMALVILLIFWLSTVTSELIGNIDYIKSVKFLIPYGFFILIPALVATGGTGFNIAGKINNKTASNKKKRMSLIALNGLCILIPCALYLRYLAVHEQFNSIFLIVQMIELIAGGVNIVMLILNVKAGIILTKNKPIKKS